MYFSLLISGQDQNQPCKLENYPHGFLIGQTSGPRLPQKQSEMLHLKQVCLRMGGPFAHLDGQE